MAKNQKKNRRNMIITLSSIWFVVTLPLPWLFTSPDVTQKPELTT